MITTNHPLIQLLALIDEVWITVEGEAGRKGAPRLYSEKTMFKVYIVSVLRKLWARRSLWRYLQNTPLVAAPVGCPASQTVSRLTDGYRTLPHRRKPKYALGLVLALEAVTDATVVASDGSAFATSGPVWHKKGKQAGQIPAGLHGLDTEADWIQSTYHGWVYGYKAHVSISVAPTTVRVVLDATVTGSS